MITRQAKCPPHGVHFFAEEVKKEDRYKIFIDVQRKKMEFDRERMKEKLNIVRKKI